MGLLDWLTDGIGSSMGGSSAPMVDATNNYASPGSAPLSPNEMSPAMPSPPPVPAPPSAPSAPLTPNSPPVDPSTTDIAGGMQGAGSGAPPVPLPTARPPGAPGAMPPAATPTAGTGTPGAPLNITSPAPNPDSSPAAPPVKPYQLGDQTALGRALGINPNPTNPASNGFRSAMAGLGEGLTAAGNSKGKTAGAAFAAGAGGALTGATKQDTAQYDQRLKSLTLAVAAQTAGDKATYNKNYADYLKGKLANDAKDTTTGGKKSSSWNKPDSQKFIDAQNALAKDPDIKASQKALEQLGSAEGTNSPQFATAQAAHTALVQQKQAMYLTGVGLNPAQIQANITNPPGTPQNPQIVNSKADFDTYVKPGQAYKNPADGKIYIRKAEGADQSSDDQQAPAASAPSAPAPPGPMPGTAAAPPSADDDD